MAPGVIAQSALFVAIIMRVPMTWNPLRWLAVFGVVMLGSAFFCCLSLTIAGIVLHRDRLMGIGQAITMPLFFASNALYPTAIMPGWVKVLANVNPLSYEVQMMRGLLLGEPADYLQDLGVLVLAAIAMIVVASSLLGRLSR
jgi:ABC-2 type transport system permease protein